MNEFTRAAQARENAVRATRTRRRRRALMLALLFVLVWALLTVTLAAGLYVVAVDR